MLTNVAFIGPDTRVRARGIAYLRVRPRETARRTETPSLRRSSLSLRARLPAPRATIVASSTHRALFLQEVKGCEPIAPWIGRAGCALDNALAESFVAALK
jgi:hypothetical protein